VRTRPITVLSFGGGQNSAALLQLALHDASFRERFLDGDLLVVMADTGAEHPETIAYVEEVKALCAERGIPFLHVTPDLGFHTGSWAKGLVGQYEATATVGSVGFQASCTDSLKIAPLYKAIEAWISREYGFPTGRGKLALKEYVRVFGRKLPVWIGFGAEERHRLPASAAQLGLDGILPKEKPRYLWFEECIASVYPLVELGMDRAACQSYIASLGATDPPPSLCLYCHWKSHAEVEWMRRLMPDKLQLWLALERRKLDVWEGRVSKKSGLPIKNNGVKGSKTLETFVAEAEEMYRSWTTEQLKEHIFSHGHTVNARYAA
jgi:hypothetical protein